MFFIALHAPFWDAAADREIYPFDGVLDRAMLAYRSPVGFDVGGSPVEGLSHRHRSERTITAHTFGELHDGYIMHATPLKEAMGVTCITAPRPDHGLLFRNRFRRLPDPESVYGS